MNDVGGYHHYNKAERSVINTGRSAQAWKAAGGKRTSTPRTKRLRKRAPTSMSTRAPASTQGGRGRYRPPRQPVERVRRRCRPAASEDGRDPARFESAVLDSSFGGYRIPAWRARSLAQVIMLGDQTFKPGCSAHWTQDQQLPGGAQNLPRGPPSAATRSSTHCRLQAKNLPQGSPTRDAPGRISKVMPKVRRAERRACSMAERQSLPEQARQEFRAKTEAPVCKAAPASDVGHKRASKPLRWCMNWVGKSPRS